MLPRLQWVEQRTVVTVRLLQALPATREGGLGWEEKKKRKKEGRKGGRGCSRWAGPDKKKEKKKEEKERRWGGRKESLKIK